MGMALIWCMTHLFCKKCTKNLFVFAAHALRCQNKPRKPSIYHNETTKNDGARSRNWTSDTRIFNLVSGYWIRSAISYFLVTIQCIGSKLVLAISSVYPQLSGSICYPAATQKFGNDHESKAKQIGSGKSRSQIRTIYDLGQRPQRFCLKIQPRGRRCYFVYYRTVSHQQRKPAIGLFGKITTEEARQIAKRWIGGALAGQDIRAGSQLRESI